MIPLEFSSVVVITDPLISLADAKDHLKETDPARDAEIGRLILAAQLVILRDLNKAADPAWTEATLPANVRQAVLLLLTHLDEHRSGGERDPSTGSDTADAQVWEAIDRLLRPAKDPVIA